MEKERNKKTMPKKSTEKKQKIMTFNLLKKEVEEYGFHYSFKTFMWQLLLLLAFVIAVSFICKLKTPYIVILCMVAIFLFPFIAVAQFRLLHNIDRFEQVELYVNNILPVFKQTPKILYALKSVEELVHGTMNACVRRAIEYIESNSEDAKLYENAFKIIENEFPNSRIVSIHQLMMNVECGSSQDYYSTADNVYFDVQQWISRTYQYQKDINRQKMGLLLLCIFAVIMNALFTYLFNSNDIMSGYLTSFSYQIITASFLILMMAVICILQMKLNGQWLVNDKTQKMDKKVMNAYAFVKAGNKKIPLPMLVICLLMLIGGAGLIYAGIWLIGMPTCGLALICLFLSKNSYRSCKKTVTTAINIEFPIWLREIALNLKNYTVVNAICNSSDNSSDIMKPFVNDFMKAIENDPVSIVPYNTFFKGYDFPDGQSSLKILYSLRNLKKEEIDNQINSLVVRNQDMLAKSEKLRNDNYLSGMEMLGYIPVIAVMMLIGAHMLFLFFYMFSMIGTLTVTP